jgi:hypothetical protein
MSLSKDSFDWSDDYDQAVEMGELPAYGNDVNGKSTVLSEPSTFSKIGAVEALSEDGNLGHNLVSSGIKP